MGRSSKPVFKLSTPEDIETYYVESFEKWREQVEIKNMNLAGYGFGAYISSKYALRYPGVVQKLFLLSPFGVEENDFLFQYSNRIVIHQDGFCDRCTRRTNDGVHSSKSIILYQFK